MTKERNLKRVAYVGSSHHIQKTKSTIFLINLLQENYHVDLIITDHWTNDFVPVEISTDRLYDAVLFFQSVPQGVLKLKVRDNWIFVPMYDQSGGDPVENWLVYRDYKILCFSRTMGKKLDKWGFRTFSTLYYPQPKIQTSPEAGTLFFWQRRPEVHWNSIRQLIPEGYLKKVHLHLAVDHGEPVYPSSEEQKQIAFTFSNWFESNEEFQKLLSQNEIFVAPRLAEGIGFSFLEAMALGIVVIAVNKPTMNEYIKHGKTGYLFDPQNPKIMDLSEIEGIRQQLPLEMEQGYQRWLIDREKIIQFINAPLVPLGPQWTFTVILGKTRLFLRLLKKKLRRKF